MHGRLLLLLLSTALLTTPAFDLQGHRGARGLAPENTLPAFERALELAVDTLELDLAVTRDGVLVVSHDPVLNPDITRDAAGHWLDGPGPAIVSLDYAQLRGYDVGRIRPGTAYAKRFPEQAGAEHVRIPTLDEVYALTRRHGNDRVRFNVETKLDPTRPHETLAADAFADAVVAVIRGNHMEKRTTIQSFDWRTLRRVQQRAPEIDTVCLTIESPVENNVRAVGGRPSAWTAGLDLADHDGSVPRLVKAAGCAVWSPSHENLRLALVSEAHSLGLKVIPWTVNDAATMLDVIAFGVDGLITDRPDIAAIVLKR